MTDLIQMEKERRLLANDLVSIVDVAKEMVVNSPKTYQLAMAVMTEQVTPYKKRVKAKFDEQVADAKKPYDNVRKMRSDLLESADQIKAILSPKILRYEAEQKRIEREEERKEQERIDREQARIDKENEAKAKKLRAKGNEEQAQAVEENKTELPPAFVPSAVPKVKGTHTRSNWKYRVTNFKLLNKKWKRWVEDEEALKLYAKNMKKAHKEPGLEIYDDAIKVF